MVHRQGLVPGQSKSRQSGRKYCTQKQSGFLYKKNPTGNCCTASHAEQCADCKHVRKGRQSRKQRIGADCKEHLRDTEYVETHLLLNPIDGKLENSRQQVGEKNGINRYPSERREKYTKAAETFDNDSSPVRSMPSLKLTTHSEVLSHITIDIRHKDRIPSEYASEDLVKLLEVPHRSPEPGFATFGISLSYRNIGDRPPPGLAEKLVKEMEKACV